MKNYKYNEKTWKLLNDLESPRKDRNGNQIFLIDKVYLFNTLLYRNRIRFVKYPDLEKDDVQILIMSISRLLKLYRFIAYPFINLKLLFMKYKEKKISFKFRFYEGVPDFLWTNETKILSITEAEKLFNLKLI
jgi:hypothetical protein